MNFRHLSLFWDRLIGEFEIYSPVESGASPRRISPPTGVKRWYPDGRLPAGELKKY